MTEGVSLAEALSGPPTFERCDGGIGRLTFPLNDCSPNAYLHIPCADKEFAERVVRILALTITSSPDYVSGRGHICAIPHERRGCAFCERDRLKERLRGIQRTLEALTEGAPSRESGRYVEIRIASTLLQQMAEECAA